MNEIHEEKSWFKRHWKWLVPLVAVSLLFFGLLFTSPLGRNVVGIAKVYSEASVCEGALEIVKKDEKVVQLLGEIMPLGKLAILEGAHQYSKDYNTLKITVDIRGSQTEKKIRSKMDVTAERDGDGWIYKTINVRIKKPEELKQTIQIVNQ